MGTATRHGATGCAEGEVLLSRETHRVALAINSFSTPAGGVTLRVVDVGRGQEAADYDGRELTGALVLADEPLGPVWAQAVRTRGAAGVLSTDLPRYTRPDDTPDVLQWGSIPFDESSFGFKATPRVTRPLREALRAGPVTVHVDIESVFHRRPNCTLVAEIPGRGLPNERVVLVAHVQEPGANDDASGCGPLLAAARAMEGAVRRGALPPPAWKDSDEFRVQSSEFRGSRFNGAPRTSSATWRRRPPRDCARS